MKICLVGSSGRNPADGCSSSTITLVPCAERPEWTKRKQVRDVSGGGAAEGGVEGMMRRLLFKKEKKKKCEEEKRTGQMELKICFAASSGGHYEELLMLRPLMERYKSFVVTEKTPYGASIEGKKTYYLCQTNRKEKTFLIQMMKNTLKSLFLLWRERPDVTICTGVLATVPLCLITKLMGRKLIYIESFAKVTSATMTGKLLYRFADQFYVQWETMLSIYPGAIYLGGIY